MRDAANQTEHAGNAPAQVRRLSIRFIGEVQGVGFRWTAQARARENGCTGWVRNERDGSVSMELQGTSDQIARFFGSFNRLYSRYPIQYVMDEVEDIKPVTGESDFSVRFYR